MPATVHIVDDDASFRTSVGRLLRACGYGVETYESAEELLTRLPDDPGMSCILLDIKMPGVGGPELQNRLNAVGPPIIVLTGHADIPTTVHVIKAGAFTTSLQPIDKPCVSAIEGALARVPLAKFSNAAISVRFRRQLLGSVLQESAPILSGLGVPN